MPFLKTRTFLEISARPSNATICLLVNARSAWGADYRMVGGKWDSSKAARFQRSVAEVRDPHQLRMNSYRVLLTRGREASVIFVPKVAEMDETAEYLRASGVVAL